MSYETSTKELPVAITEKIKTLLETDPDLQDIRKIYEGFPGAIPNYPAIIIDWDRADHSHESKGKTQIETLNHLSVVVLNKHYDKQKGFTKLLEYTQKTKKRLLNNRYLNGLRASDNSWKVLDSFLEETQFSTLAIPRDYVLNAHEIKYTVKTEGL